MTSNAATLLRHETFSAGAGPRRWHIARNGERRGPLSDVELVWLAGDGAIGPDDLVWRPGYLAWTPAGKIAGLLIPPDLPDPDPGPSSGSIPPAPPEPPEAPPVPFVADEAPPPATRGAAVTAAPRAHHDAPPADTAAAAEAIPAAAAPPPPATTAAAPPLPAEPASKPVPRPKSAPAAADAAPVPAFMAASPAPPDESLRAMLMAMGPPAQRRRNYLLRHWRGELPLLRSFWIDGVLLTGPVVALCAWIIFSVSDNAIHLPHWLGLGAVATQPSWFLPFAVRLLLIPAVAMQVWCIVGIYRSACRREGMWGEVATATAVCSALCCTVFTLLMLRG